MKIGIDRMPKKLSSMLSDYRKLFELFQFLNPTAYDLPLLRLN